MRDADTTRCEHRARKITCAGTRHCVRVWCPVYRVCRHQDLQSVSSVVSPTSSPRHRTDNMAETHHALLVQLLSVFVVLARRALYPSWHPPALQASLRSSVRQPVGRASHRPKSMRVSHSPLILRSYRLSLHVAVHVQPCRGQASGDPQRHGEQAATPLKSDDITHSCIGSWVSRLVQACAHLKQTIGRDQRLAHICDFPCGVHVASSTRLDTRTPLPVMFDMGSFRAFKTNLLPDLAVFYKGHSLHFVFGSTFVNRSRIDERQQLSTALGLVLLADHGIDPHVGPMTPVQTTVSVAGFARSYFTHILPIIRG